MNRYLLAEVFTSSLSTNFKFFKFEIAVKQHQLIQDKCLLRPKTNKETYNKSKALFRPCDSIEKLTETTLSLISQIDTGRIDITVFVKKSNEPEAFTVEVITPKTQ